MGVPESVGSDVPNLMKDVPNLMKDVPNFFEGCTKGPKMCYEVGIRPKSLFYGFLNEIVAHPWSEGGPGITKLVCTKFNEGCTKFCEGCTKCFEGCTKCF